MAKHAVLISRVSGGAIYFEADETARYAETNMHYFDTLRELADFVKSIRSGWRYTDAGTWTRVTRNHMIASVYNVYGERANLAEIDRLDSLPDWMNR